VYDGYYFGIAPQGDAARMYNHVRCVRGAAISPTADTDGDGLTDWYEWNYTYSTNGMEATDDDDGDGASNEEEEKAGTVPTDPDSVLSVTQFAVDGTGMNLSWCSELGVTYRLLCSTNLLADTFGAVVDSGILATPPVNTYTNLPLGTGAYYRVEVE
jgi:hypothetical protein